MTQIMQITLDFRIPKYCFFIISFVIIINSCETPPSDPDEIEKLSIRAFFTSDTTRQNIYLYKSAFLKEDDSPYSDYYFYDKANISLLSDNEENIPFYYQKTDSFGYNRYINREGINFKPRKKYSLRIESEYNTIEGETTFPGEFEIISPAAENIFFGDENFVRSGNGESYYLVDINIHWTKSKDAYIYLIDFIPRYLNPSLSHDTVYNCSIFFDKNWVYDSTRNSLITITAIDKNFYQHHFEQYNRAGVKGGYGYFGSGTVKSVQFKFKKR